MISGSKTLGDVLRLGRFEPARVQREFQWKRRQIDRLLEDLVGSFQRLGEDPGGDDVEQGASDGDSFDAAAGRQHTVASGTHPRRSYKPTRQPPDCYYLGNIILWIGDRSSTYQVYDGLQRLTTLTIMIAALRQTWRDLGGTDEILIEQLLFDEDSRRHRVARLQFPTAGASLASIVSGSSFRTGSIRLTGGDYRMRDATDFFWERFAAGWPEARRRAFVSFLINRVRLSVTTTDNHSVAYQMFVGANTRGLHLAIGDTLKGLLADQLRGLGATQEIVADCVGRWRNAQDVLGNSFDDCLHALEMLRLKSDPPATNGKKPNVESHTTGEFIQEFFLAANSSEDLRNWLSTDFQMAVNVFARLRVHLRLHATSDVETSFRQLFFLEWKEWQPLLLAIGARHESLEGAQFEIEVADLKRASYVVELLDWREGTRRSKFYRAMRQYESGLDPFAGPANGKEGLGELFFGQTGALTAVSRALRAPLMSEEKRGTIVRWIETLHWGGQVPKSATDDANVEHVLPVAAVGEWGKTFSGEERQRFTHLIGNLSLLDKTTNKRIGNSQWADKRRTYEQWRTTFKGIDAALRVVEDFEKQLGKYCEWNAEAVELLTERLARLAEKGLGILK